MAKTQVNFNLATVQQAVSWGLLITHNGRNFCQTGSMSISRADMDALIGAIGGNVHNAVKTNTDFLIIPNDPSFRRGSKYKEAQDRGKTVITEEEFCGMILPTVEQLLGDSNAGSTT